jgi:hypothetical protein
MDNREKPFQYSGSLSLAVVASVEEARKRMDASQVMIELRSRIVGADIDLVSPTRHLVREGVLRYNAHQRDKLQLCYVLLFNDLSALERNGPIFYHRLPRFLRKIFIGDLLRGWTIKSLKKVPSLCLLML